MVSSSESQARLPVSRYSATNPFWYWNALIAAASSMSASCWVTASRATLEVCSSEDSPTAHTTPIAVAVPSDAAARRPESPEDRYLLTRLL